MVIITITEDDRSALTGQESTLALSGKRIPKVGDHLEFWENPRKPDRKLLGVSLCRSAEKIGGKVVISWDAAYFAKRRLLPQVKKQGNFLIDAVTEADAPPALDTDKSRMEFAWAWCQFCKKTEKCPIQKDKEHQAAHLVAHEGSIVCTVFTPRYAQRWEFDRRDYLNLEKRGQLNLLEGVPLG